MLAGSATNQPPQKMVPRRELQLLTMFYDSDDFCKRFVSIVHRHLLQPGPGTRLRQLALALSESKVRCSIRRL